MQAIDSDISYYPFLGGACTIADGKRVFYSDYMKFLEKSLEQIIMDTPNKDLQDRDLYITGRKRNQVRIGNYGIADVVSVATRGNHPFIDHLVIQVYELKKDTIDIAAFFQCLRYIKGIDQYFNYKDKDYIQRHYQLCLIGSQIDNSDFIYLPDVINSDDELSTSIVFYTYKYEFDGIKFNYESEYCLTNEGFNHG